MAIARITCDSGLPLRFGVDGAGSTAGTSNVEEILSVTAIAEIYAIWVPVKAKQNAACARIVPGGLWNIGLGGLTCGGVGLAPIKVIVALGSIKKIRTAGIRSDRGRAPTRA